MFGNVISFTSIIPSAGKDSCGGDSGGPASYHEGYEGTVDAKPWFQIGIVSFGAKKCGKINKPGVYTRIDTFLDWIKRNLEA